MKSLILAALAALLCAGGAAAQAPLAAYGDLPSTEQVAISPGGQELAFDLVKGDQRTIAVENLVTQQVVLKVQVGDTKIRGLTWVGNDHVVITSSSTNNLFMVLTARNEWYQAADLNIPQKRITPLLGDIDYTSNFISDDPIVRTVD